MAAIARLGDTSTHGGSITSASGDSFCNGIGIARIGDSFNCPIHGLQTITIGGIAKCNNRAIARVGDFISCGAIISSGSPNTEA